MAEPVGITGTAVGIVSLCLQMYSGLKGYLDDYRGRNEYVRKALVHLDRLQRLISVVESVIPALRNGHYTPSQTVVLCLQDCEDQIKFLDTELQKYSRPVPTNLKGKLKDTMRKLEFPLARPELERLASNLDRINNLITVALQALGLHIQSTNQDELKDLSGSIRAAVVEMATIQAKVDEIKSRGAALEACVGSNQTAITEISRDLHGLSLVATEIRSSVPQINEIQANTSSSIDILREISSGYRLQQLNSIAQGERLNELKHAIVTSNKNSPGERFFQMLMSKPDVLKSWQDDITNITTIRRTSPTVSIENALESSQLKRKYQLEAMSSSCECQYRHRISRHSSRWLCFTRFDESIVDLHHEPGCSIYGITE
ncbi:hypothetical protein Hte_009204 [Hypoxylon texense]